MANPEHVEILKKGVAVWNKWRNESGCSRPDLKGLALKDTNLSKANFNDTDLSGIAAKRVDLSGASLRHANLEGAALMHANLSCADLFGANLKDIDLDSSNLEVADFMFAGMQNAILYKANLRKSNLACANLHGANFRGADLTGATLSGANLTGATLDDVKFSQYCCGYSQGVWLDGCHGSERFRRFILHQSFIEELASAGWISRFLVGIWAVLADCGRTPWAWVGWSVTFCLYYAAIYLFLGIAAFDFDTSLPFNFGSTLYYSIVTFTTLGFGDITPATGLAAFYVTLEVITGYVMLGGLISFIFSKLLPRG